MDELYLENIDEYVTDQNKIVTYKWLSYTLGVHVNQAKQMLYDYVERKRKENSGVHLHVTYLVTGKHVQNGYPYHKVAVVKEEKLESVKSKLAVISSVHVYSIQKAVLKDSGPLFSTDYDIIKANLDICNKFSAIQCTFAVRRAPAEMAKSQKSSQQLNEQQVTSAPITNGHVPPPSSKATSQPPKGIMGMFATKGTSKPQTAGKDSKPEVKEAPASTVSSKSTAKSNAVNNFFGKASMKKKASSDLEQMVKEEKSTSQLVSPEPENEVCMSSTVDRPVEKVEEEPAEQPVESLLSRADSATQQKKGKKSKVKRSDVSDSDDEKTTKKKRRRIKKPVSESSEDEVDAPASPAAMEEQLQPPSPPKPAVKAKPESQPAEAQTTGKKRKRRRVLKSHTFMDEEGCIVTEKRYETESCTDSESESAKPKPAAPKQSAAPAAKQEPKASKKSAAASSKGTKQASIMGFFQKK